MNINWQLLQYQAEQARIERVAQIRLNNPSKSWEEAEEAERAIRDFNIGRELLKE